MRGLLALIDRAAAAVGSGRRLVRCAAAGQSYHSAGQVCRPHRRGRLHAAAGRGAPRRARRAAIRSRAHASKPERNHHHQELSQHRAQQLERCGAGDLARRHREELQRGHAAAAGLTPRRELRRQADDQLHRRCASARFRSVALGAEARETVFRTASGQTIPVSMARSAITTRRPPVPGQHLRRAQHHRAQARRAPHPLSGALRHADEDAESHAVPASAAAGDRALRAAISARWRCCIWISTASRKSTIPSATRPATVHWRS